MIFGKKYNVHFDFNAGIIIIIRVIAIEQNVSNPQVNKWKGREKKNLPSWICMGFEASLT